MVASRLAFATLLIVLAGCDSSGLDERERAELQSGEAQVELGETVRLDGLAIRFAAVLEDSRCPLDVQCVSAGEARVALTIDGEAFELLVIDSQYVPAAGVRIGDVIVYAVGLVPYPRQGNPSNATPVVAISTVPAEG